MKTAIIALTGLLTKWHQTCALGGPSLFARWSWWGSRAQGGRLRQQQCAQEGWPGQVEVIWAVPAMQQQLGEERGLVCASSPGHVSHPKAPPSQSIQRVQCFQWVLFQQGEHLKGASLFCKFLCSCTEQIEQAAAMAHPPCGSAAHSQCSQQSLAVVVIFWDEKSLIRNCLLLPLTDWSLYPSLERVITVALWSELPWSPHPWQKSCVCCPQSCEPSRLKGSHPWCGYTLTERHRTSPLLLFNSLLRSGTLSVSVLFPYQDLPARQTEVLVNKRQLILHFLTVSTFCVTPHAEMYFKRALCCACAAWHCNGNRFNSLHFPSKHSLGVFWQLNWSLVSFPWNFSAKPTFFPNGWECPLHFCSLRCACGSPVAHLLPVGAQNRNDTMGSPAWQ